MGQKVHPKGFRVGINKGWDSEWTADKKDMAKFIKQDNMIRKFLKEKLAGIVIPGKDKHKDLAISKIIILRQRDKITLNIHTGKPAILIGAKGAGVELMKKELVKLIKNENININIHEVKNVDSDATLVAEGIAIALAKRASWRRTMKQAVQRAMRAGAKGIKVIISGRLDGAEIARSETQKEGTLPLHTLRSNIDYGVATSRTVAGAIGVKVWIYHGQILESKIPHTTLQKNNKEVDA